MRVRRTRGGGSRATVSASGQRAASATSFSHVMHARQLEAHQKQLEELYSRLEVLADSMSATTPLQDWENFRSLVYAHLNEVKAGYYLRKELAWDLRGNKRLLVLIEIVDRELVELGLSFIERQDDNLAFLARVKRLKGLLLDLKS